MGRFKRYLPNRVVSLIHQLTDVRRHLVGFDGTITSKGLTVSGTLRPTPVSREYAVRIELPKNGIPKILIDSSELLGRGGERIPHRYPDGSLCLYYPPNREWRREFFLTETLIPWAEEWLYFYEIWLISGVWHGSGLHPTANQQNE